MVHFVRMYIQNQICKCLNKEFFKNMHIADDDSETHLHDIS